MSTEGRGKREKGTKKSNVDDLRKALQQDGTKSRLELLEVNINIYI